MKIVTLGVDDWHVLYIDGEKVEENHSLLASDVLEAIVERFKEGEALEYQDFFFEPKDREEREEWELGIWYEQKLKDVDPHLRQGIVF